MSDSSVIRTQLKAVLAEHMTPTKRRGVLELSWDRTQQSSSAHHRDLSLTLQQSLECVYIQDSSPTGHKRTTLLSIKPGSIRTIEDHAEHEDKWLETVQINPSQSKARPRIKAKPKVLNKDLKLSGLQYPVGGFKDFQDEFMGKYEEFSQSWRDQIDRQRRF